MSKHSSMEGGGVPEMLARLRQGAASGVPRWERWAMGLLVGHLLAYTVPGPDQARVCAPASRSHGSGRDVETWGTKETRNAGHQQR